MTLIRNLHRQWMKNPDYRAAYDALDEEFQLAHLIIQARKRAGLSQAQLAQRMRTSQSYVARLEGGAISPSAAALTRFADATGMAVWVVPVTMKTTASRGLRRLGGFPIVGTARGRPISRRTPRRAAGARVRGKVGKHS